MEPNDQPASAYLIVAPVSHPVALLAVALGLVVAIAWLVMTSGDLSMPEALAFGK